MQILEAKNIVKTFYKIGGEINVLNSLEIDVIKGEIILFTTVLEGPSQPSPHPVIPSSVLILTMPIDLLFVQACDHPKGVSRDALRL